MLGGINSCICYKQYEYKPIFRFCALEMLFWIFCTNYGLPILMLIVYRHFTQKYKQGRSFPQRGCVRLHERKKND